MQYRNIEILESLSWLMHEADSRTTARGFSYYSQNRVSLIKEQNGIFFAKVSGSYNYNVKIDSDKKQALCDCPAYFPCKHIIALVFFLSEVEEKKNVNQKNLSQNISIKNIKNNIAKFPENASVKKKKKVSEEFIFQAIDDHCFAARKYNPETKIISEINFTDRLVLVDGSYVEYYYLINFVNMSHRPIYFNEIVHSRFFGNIHFFTKENIPMQFKGVLPVFQKLVKIKNADANEEIKIQKTNPPKLQGDSYRIENYYFDPVQKKEVLYPAAAGIDYFSREHLNKLVFENNSSKPKNSNLPLDVNFYITGFDDFTYEIYRFSKGGLKVISDLEIIERKNLMTAAKVKNILKLAPKEFDKGPVFSLSIYPDEKGQFKVKCRAEFIYSVDEKYFDTKLLAKTISSESSTKYIARFPARALNSSQPFKYQKDVHGNIAKRNTKQERQIFRNFDQSPIPFHKKEYILMPGEISNFIEKEVPSLQEAGAKIHIHKNLMRLMKNKNNNKAVFKINKKTNDINWFDGHLSIEGMGLRELRLALKAYRKKEDYFLLSDGSWVSLDSIGIAKLAESFENLGVHISADGEIKKVNRGQMLAIEFEMDMRTDAAIENLSKKIQALPQKRKNATGFFQTSFKGELRDYQREGVLFLESLYEIGIGGVLADDMGLGKTIQGLTFIERLTRQKNSLLTLIVGPLASVSIWKKEAQKYFPDLNVTIWHGTDRKKSEFPKQGIVLTTYGTLSRDYADWKENHHFDLAILDEAQNLKNFRTLSSHAVRQTNTELYFCLTGTPLENSLNDLWSLFDICFPGYLGTQKSFSKNYSDPHQESHKILRKKIEPFVMRRTKGEVLKELPPLTETWVPVAMAEKQKVFYEEARKQALMELANAGKNYLMVMLPHLMKLRRIACHPEAGNSETTNPLLSGKFIHLKDILNELKSSSSGILIFSQFTDILKICGKLLQDLDYDYHYLDGSTPLKKRDKMVTEFQNGEKSFFLISLKAGGTALTLHRADTVIHLDPWWNPAVERQASDRVHRIGQTQKVFVYKLYSENSIEEKVIELQSIKKEIFENIFGDSMKNSEKITRDQIKKLLEE
ncbi:MAG: DEAD/DEAH box helicase [Spirochaetia bacterium]|nr:DEAD/DEAH box helicase [Spirochaetia bacterium]